MGFQIITQISVQQIMDTLIPPDSAIQYQNAQLTGAPECAALFSGSEFVVTDPSLNFPSAGVVLGTGLPSDLYGQDGTDSYYNFNTPGDPDLSPFEQTPTYDACTISFDFNCGNSEQEDVELPYSFASDEYLEHVVENLGYGDNFGIILNGVNVATVPGTGPPEVDVTLFTVNQFDNNEFFVHNRPRPGQSLYPGFEPDGFTQNLIARGALKSNGAMNTMKIGITDVIDPYSDSWLFLHEMKCVEPDPRPPSSKPPSREPMATEAPSVAPTSEPTIDEVNFELTLRATVQQIMDTLILTDSSAGGIEYQNAQLTGADRCAALFSGSDTIITDPSLNFPSAGVVLGTGLPSHLYGQHGTETYYNFNQPGDPDLNPFNDLPTYDACMISFEFYCGNSEQDVELAYSFASDEYMEQIIEGLTFADSFGIILNGVNIATVPGTGPPEEGVTLFNVNQFVNSEYFVYNDPRPGRATYAGFEPDGFTHNLIARGTLKPNGAINSIKIGITDVGDPYFDSWLFLGNLKCIESDPRPPSTAPPTTKEPTLQPPTEQPTRIPTLTPTDEPTSKSPITSPSSEPTPIPSVEPSKTPTLAPSLSPTKLTPVPSDIPSISSHPTCQDIFDKPIKFKGTPIDPNKPPPKKGDIVGQGKWDALPKFLNNHFPKGIKIGKFELDATCVAVKDGFASAPDCDFTFNLKFRSFGAVTQGTFKVGGVGPIKEDIGMATGSFVGIPGKVISTGEFKGFTADPMNGNYSSFVFRFVFCY